MYLAPFFAIFRFALAEETFVPRCFPMAARFFARNDYLATAMQIACELARAGLCVLNQPK
ncbi:MAG: hypothetical protein LH479_04850 [Polaromonas sp.]|nr:hypothetical protein [Polaromonas sp.]